MTNVSPTADNTVPHVLDLDGTLIRTVSLREQALAMVRRKPIDVFRLIAWVFAGRVVLKERLAAASHGEPEYLPENDEVVALGQQAAAEGRKVILATAAHANTAKPFQKHFPFITEVLATGHGVNLKGKAKAEELARRFPDGFDYAGDSRADLEVWKRARNAIAVGASASTVRMAHKVSNVVQVLPRPPVLKAFVKCLRPHQWAKNVLVVVPAARCPSTEKPFAPLSSSYWCIP